MRHWLKVGITVCTIIGIAVLGHEAIEQAKWQKQKIEKRIACNWLGDQLLTNPSSPTRANPLNPEVIILERYCWEGRKAAVESTNNGRRS